MEVEKRSKNAGKKWLLLPLFFLILAILILAFIIVPPYLKQTNVVEDSEASILTKTELIEACDIAELSTAEFVYAGIAEIPENSDSDKIKCRVKYEAKIKATVDMGDFDFTIDEENRTVKPILSEIKLTTILNDQEGFSFIPEKTDADLQEVIEACKRDVENETKQNDELRQTAEENLKDIVQALISPITDKKEYTIIWD